MTLSGTVNKSALSLFILLIAASGARNGIAKNEKGIENMPKTSQLRTTVGVFVWIVLVLNVTVAWIAHAQQAGRPQSRGAKPPAGTPAEAPNFVGKTLALDGSNISAGRRFFAAGGRSNWHSHPNGQLLLGESGIGLHQVEGKPVMRLAPGESAYVGPGVVHWHGAAPDEGFTQIHIGFGGTTKWGGPVPDVVYRGTAAR